MTGTGYIGFALVAIGLIIALATGMTGVGLGVGLAIAALGAAIMGYELMV